MTTATKTKLKKRVTVKLMRAALKQTGMTLESQNYFSGKNPGVYCSGCLLTVLWAYEHGYTYLSLKRMRKHIRGGAIRDWAERHFGSIDYVSGLIEGFDGNGEDRYMSDCRMGFADGKKCRRLLPEDD